MVQGGRWGGVARRRGRHSQPAAARQLDHPQLEAVLHALAHGALDPVLERLDEETRGMGTTDYNYDLVR